MKLKEEKSCVYGIYDHNSKLIYVGCSKNYLNRYNSHRSSLQNSTHENKVLQKYCDLVGFDNLSFVPLFFCNEKELLHNELMFIKMFSPLCNVHGINKINVKFAHETNLITKNFNNEDILDFMKDIVFNQNYTKKSIYEKFRSFDSKITPKKTKMYLDHFCKINNYVIIHGNSLIGRTCRIEKIKTPNFH